LKKPKPLRIFDVQEILDYYQECFPDRERPTLREVQWVFDDDKGKSYRDLVNNGECLSIAHEYIDGKTIDDNGFYSSEFHKWLIKEFGDKNKDVELKIWW
jgi:hypothetical protein